VRPSPRPPVDARPRQLSVTEIEKLLRDPYWIYARRVLGLRRLDGLARTPDAGLRGSVLHKIVERMLREDVDPGAPDAAARMAAITDRVLESAVPWPATRRLWRGRVLSVIPRLLEGEVRRRAEGTPFEPERKGALGFDDIGFTLTGTADRIDSLDGRTLAIYDYKSTSIPTDKQVRFFNRQLGLEAVMAEAGAFQDVPAGTVTKLGYIALGPSGRDRVFAAAGEHAPAIVEAEFRRLIAAFAERDRGYSARRSVANVTFEGDYDQLARFGEWDDSDDPFPEEVG
jgi:RecB family exonuclease